MNQEQELATEEQLALLVQKQLGISIRTMQSVLDDPNTISTLVAAAGCTAAAMQQGRKLMVAGNGGSAADSQHLVAEFVSRLTVDRRALPAIALTVDTSILTAIGNDYDYQNVFERQIEALGQRGDVFLALSTSGNSKNILKSLACARAMGIKTIGFSGSGGGRMAELCDYSVVVPSSVTMNIQECHIALEHIFCMLVEKRIFGMGFGAS
ncbi:MAG TPA: D-sedoheptulose 7-phosphate isomerase [Acidobacteriaceae bacterium]|jgi:D-sedoheptulose 7-phosphate isomerase|nr:D-sedoheptulose 7-phosphate isomerase [Acidobacteriaceae bacterium]